MTTSDGNLHCVFGRPHEAAAAWRQAAEDGDAEAQYAYACTLANAHGAERNDRTAFYWYERAAEAGHIDAQYTLAMLLYEGWGCAVDDRRARQWLVRAATSGHATARRRLDGEYVPPPHRPTPPPLGWLARLAAATRRHA